MNTLFVYGTLKPGFPNNHILKAFGGNFFKATLLGFQFDKVWEKKTGYPGLIKSDSNSKVEGFLFVSENLIDNWKVLDDFETKAYSRKIVSVLLEDNRKVDGFVYVINTDFDITNF